jgi:hypothetical protein
MKQYEFNVNPAIMNLIELKIRAREILVANQDMLSSLYYEFMELLNSDPYFEYREDEFLYWVIDGFIETLNGQDNYIFN